jgi:dystrophin
LSETKLVEHNLHVIKSEWHELLVKYAKFQKPSDFDHKLERIRVMLSDVDVSLVSILCTSGDDLDTMYAQLDACMRVYKVLSELKPQVEQLLKQGRGIVDKRQVDNTDELTKQLDGLKHKYNELGSSVTNAK